MKKKVENSNNAETPRLNIAGVKCRFFVQYWGVKCMYVGGVGLVEIGTGGWNLKHPDFFLELKPLSKISKEDAIKCWENDNYIANEDDIEQVSCLFKEMTAINADYLRSKGYAIPFMEYSVEMLVDAGWVRLS